MFFSRKKINFAEKNNTYILYMADTKIVTGQYVTLNQMPGSLGDRVLGQLIDTIVLFAYSVVVGVVLYQLGMADTMTDNMLVTMLIALYLPVLLYHPLMELLHHGQSVGKTVMHTRVVNIDGTSPTLGGYLLRFLLMPIDMMGVGLVSIVLTRRAQRLGDLAAGTMVAKTKTPYIALPDYSYTMEGYVPTYSEASELSMNQAELINRVLNYMRPDRAELVNRLALKIQKTYGVVPQDGTQEQFLYTMLNDYGYYCSTIEA